MAKSIQFNLKFDSNGNVVIGDLTVNAKNLSKALDSVKKSMSSVSDRFRNYMAATSGFVVSLQGAVSGLTSLSESTVSFDTAMRAANTMAGKGREEFEALKKAVNGLSREIPIARDLLANGLYQTISNGVPEDNWIEFLEASARSAVGGMANLEEVVKVTSTVIKNYGYSWEDAMAIQDKIQMTAKNGVTSFEQLAQALPRVTGNAATLGVSIDELLATFSTLTGVSGNTAEVSTQLAAVFTALVKPSEQARKMAAAMGIEFNAAAIQAAGGLQGFLSNLDIAVKRYAQANNVLETAVYGKLFGSAESLRALGPLTGELASKYEENVAAMADSTGTIDRAFADMSESTGAKMQLLKNRFAGITDGIGRLAAKILPSVQFMAFFGQALAGCSAMLKGLGIAFISVIKHLKAYGIAVWNSTVWSKAWLAIMRLMPTSLRNASIGLTVMANAGGKAALVIKGLTGLLKASVIGAAIWGVTKLFGLFSKKTDEAAEAAAEAKKEFESWKKSLTDLSGVAESAIAREIGALDRLYKAATDETKSRAERVKAASELKTVYRDAFANLSTEAIMAGKAAEAYDKLKTSIINVARAEAAKEKIKQNESEWLDLELQRKPLQEELDALLLRYPGLDKMSPIKNDRRDESPEKQALIMSKTIYDDIRESLDAIESKQAAIIAANEKLANLGSAITTTTTGPHNDIDLTDKTYKQQLEARLAEAKEKYVTASLAGDEAEMASQKKVIDTLREKIDTITLAERAAERPAELNNLRDIDAELQYQQELRKTASKDSIAQIDAEIKRLENLKEQYRNVEVKEIADIATYQDLNDALDVYHKRMLTASAEERVEINNIINELEALRDAWDSAMNRPGDISSLDTLDKLSKAITYYQLQLQSASRAEIPGLQRIINGLLAKQSAMQRGVGLVNDRKDVDAVNGMSKDQRTTQIRSHSAESIRGKINDLKRMLSDATNPMTEVERELAEGLIKDYEDWLKLIEKKSPYESVASGIAMVGSALANIGNLLGENAAAWVNYAAQVLKSVSEMIPAIQALTAAKAAESAAETPIVGWLAVGAAIAATLAAFASIPKFADGGIAYGPTLGMFGEYSGASHNPEVVAPLDRLRGMLRPADADPGGKVEFEIDGMKLKGVLRRVEKRSERSGGLN